MYALVYAFYRALYSFYKCKRRKRGALARVIRPKDPRNEGEKRPGAKANGEQDFGLLKNLRERLILLKCNLRTS